ncbi:MAG: FAD/NAD(P)-binding oxidoreductase [Helicobacteraceae bacterium]|jgi:sulfide:quinone oxidoreductase|nr:FAD/NAD(P)-binding oxidoreductase [Helicobacteraceae bacterium]
MDQKALKELLKKNTNSEMLSRRDALKLMGISPIAAGVLASTSSSVISSAEAADAQGKIVIVGGGAGGIMALARLHSGLKNPDITIIAPNELHIYQPGQIFQAAGLYTHDDLIKPNSNFIPDNVNWIKDEVASFDPDNNTLVTRHGEKVDYDYLVVAAGIDYHYDWIRGLKEDDIGTHGISSVYLNNFEKGTTEGGSITWDWFNALKQASSTGPKPRVIYTQPNTPIKCGGAPQKILYLSADHLKKEGLSADYTFATAGGSLFGLKPIADSLATAQKRYDTITNKFKHNLISIDVINKIATFEHTYSIKGEYDEELEMYDTTEKRELVEMEYDFIHIVPPMSAAQSVVDSPLGWQKGSAKGWLEVDKETLQHRRYKNVFGIGDICGIPMGKTGGSARHHGPVMVENLIAAMQDKALKEKFDGYTVCPLKVEYGEIIMAEFNYNGLAPSFAFLAPEKPRWIWWAFDLYMLKPMYWYLMLRGLM